MIAIGIDPDTNATGIGCIDTVTGAMWAASVKAEGKTAEDRLVPMAIELRSFFKDAHADVIAIERQFLRAYKEKNPNAIMLVQAVFGSALSCVVACAPRVLIPHPSQWRGTQPKEIVQAHILERLGLTINSEVFSAIKKADRSHAIDGLGLASWAIKQKP